MSQRPEEIRYFDQIIWSGFVDVFDLEFEDKSKGICYRWERRGERKEGMKDIAREIVPATSPAFNGAFAKDLQCKPELYAYFRVKSEMAANQLNGKTVEFDFDSVIVGIVSGSGDFLVTKHSDGTVTICIVVKNALGGLHPKDAQFYLSQKEVDAIKQNPTGSITEFSCLIR